jgi:hypothetical protein
MRKVLFLFLCVIALTSCSLDTYDSTSDRLAMVGKEYLDSGIVYKVTGKNSVLLEKCTDSWNKDYLSCGIVKIDGLNFVITSISDRAFMNNKTLKVVENTDSVHKIGAQAFFGCDSLKEMQYSYTPSVQHLRRHRCDSLKEMQYSYTGLQSRDTIGESAFADCHALKFACVGNAHIEKEAFKNCSGLKTVITDTLSYIGEGAFSGCTSLHSFYLSNLQPPTIDVSAFENTNANKILHVSKGCAGAYQSAPAWKEFATIIDE